MAKIVVLSVPAFGHINPVLPILAFGRPVEGVALRHAVVKSSLIRASRSDPGHWGSPSERPVNGG